MRVDKFKNAILGIERATRGIRHGLFVNIPGIIKYHNSYRKTENYKMFKAQMTDIAKRLLNSFIISLDEANLIEPFLRPKKFSKKQMLRDSTKAIYTLNKRIANETYTEEDDIIDGPIQIDREIPLGVYNWQRIGINPKILHKRKKLPEVLLHEYSHALQDKCLYGLNSELSNDLFGMHKFEEIFGPDNITLFFEYTPDEKEAYFIGRYVRKNFIKELNKYIYAKKVHE